MLDIYGYTVEIPQGLLKVLRERDWTSVQSRSDFAKLDQNTTKSKRSLPSRSVLLKEQDG